MYSLQNDANTLPARLSRPAAMILLAALIAAIALLDCLLATYYNLGALYMIPFIVATQYIRRSGRLLLLAILLVILNYGGLLAAYVPAFKSDNWLSFRLINRGFVALSLTGAALLVVFYLRVRNYWLRRHAEMAPTDEEVSLLLQVFQMFEDITAILLAALLAGITFAVDCFTPRVMNLPILYLMPLAVVAITRSRLLLWLAVPVLLTLSYVGYFYGPPDNYDAEIVRRMVINREVAAAAIVVAAALFHYISTPSRRKPRAADKAPPTS